MPPFPSREFTFDATRIQGVFREMRGLVKETWCRLDGDRIGAVEAQRDRLLGRIQSRHGLRLDPNEVRQRS